MPCPSRPFSLQKPLGYTLPGYLQPFAPMANILREQAITNAVSAMNIDKDELISEFAAQGGEDFQVNYLSQNGLPSVELVVMGCPNASMRKRLDHVTKSAIKHASQDAGRLQTSNPSDNTHPPSPSSTSTQWSTPPPPDKAEQEKPTPTVSPDIHDTFRMLQKVMPGKRLAESQMLDLAAVLSKHHEAFATSSKDYGKVTGDYSMKHSIDTAGAKAVSQKPYRHSRFEEDFLKKLIAELQACGLIRPSVSPWMSPVVLVKKKDGSLRMCIDFRRLNAVTALDPYQLPRVDDLTDRMNGCQYFTSIDVLSAFWNMPMEEEDIPKTGFSTSFGNYEWTRMPFGLVNASASFQRLMDKLTKDLENAAAYIDDVFVFTATWEEHLTALDQTLGRMVKAGLKCKLAKCAFAGDSVKCLGHTVTKHGVTIDEDKLQAVKDVPVPSDKTGVKSFMGMMNYFRQYIKDFAAISEPLTRLTSRKLDWEWTPACQHAFEKLKACLCEKPVLAMPNFTPGHERFVPHTDLSKSAIGACLLQKGPDGEMHPIAFASRILSLAERNYAPTEGECLAVVWAVKKFRHYLHGRQFHVMTDHHALQWLQTARFTNSKLERWAMALQEHRYTIEYLKGPQNVIADCLSRPAPVQEQEALAEEGKHPEQHVSIPTSGACMPVCLVNLLHASIMQYEWQHAEAINTTLIATYGCDLDELTKREHQDGIRCTACNDPGGDKNMAFCSTCNKPYHLRCVIPPMATVPSGDWHCLTCKSGVGQIEELYDPNTPLRYSSRDMYLNDELMDCLRAGGVTSFLPPSNHKRSMRRLLEKVRWHPSIPDWIQVKLFKNKRGNPWKTSPPLAYRWDTITMYHDLLGHAGADHTHSILQQHVYWPDVRRDVRAYVLACMVCQQRKAILYQAEEMGRTAIHGALQHIHVDLAGPLKTELTDLSVPEKLLQDVSFQEDAAQQVMAAAQTRPRRQARKPVEPAPPPAAKQHARKSSSNKEAAVNKPDKPDRPMQLHWILIIVDYFTKAAEFVAVPSKSADGIAHALFDNWFSRYGLPEHVTSVNGTEFQGEFSAMLERLGINHIHTAVGHPQSNGACETLVGTIKRKLYSYCDGHAKHWIKYLPRLRYAFMQEVHRSTGISPFEALHGYVPNHPLPVKIASLTALAPSPVVQPYVNYVMMGMIQDVSMQQHVQQLRERHFNIDQGILHNINKMQEQELARFYERRKEYLNEKRCIEVGDYVFELKESPKPLQAIADGPYLVVKKDAGKVVLRTGTTKWDPVAKEYERRADLLIPCLTRKQALAKAHAKPITPANREATVVSFSIDPYTDVTFSC